MRSQGQRKTTGCQGSGGCTAEGRHQSHLVLKPLSTPVRSPPNLVAPLSAETPNLERNDVPQPLGQLRAVLLQAQSSAHTQFLRNFDPKFHPEVPPYIQSTRFRMYASQTKVSGTVLYVCNYCTDVLTCTMDSAFSGAEAHRGAASG